MNRLLLAVAGGRKTQAIADACVAAPPGRRILALGYTRASQAELGQRIRVSALAQRDVEVSGWYSFLLRHVIRPYLPLRFPGCRLTGFNFDGEPAAGRYATGSSRFLDAEGRAYALHLSKLAFEVMRASDGAAIDRLEHIYDEMHIDEVQDLAGYDLDIVKALLESRIDVRLVGDMRQALLSTNSRDPRHAKYRFERLILWFREQEVAGRLAIEERVGTYRFNQSIADFADAIFAENGEYSATVSCSTETHEHSGVFAVSPSLVPDYRARFDPLCLRYSANSGKSYNFPLETFGKAKGRTAEHVLIHPTRKIESFLSRGDALEGRAACALYIAVTRARHSVAFISDGVDAPPLRIWSP
jgi:ATP-dependent DNA helicase UvrD/PcrA